MSTGSKNKNVLLTHGKATNVGEVNACAVVGVDDTDNDACAISGHDGLDVMPDSCEPATESTAAAIGVMCDNRLPRAERLRGEIRIARLFREGESFFVYPFRCVYSVEKADENVPGIAFLISVPKRNHKRANKRNLLKRRTREAFRTQKYPLKVKAISNGVKLSVSLIYSTKDILKYKTIKDAVGKVIEKLGAEI